MEMLRRQFGIGEPVRRGMELKIAREGEWRPAVLGGASQVHRDILEGRDCEVGWEDVFTGECLLRFMPRFMARRERGCVMELWDGVIVVYEAMLIHYDRQRTPRGTRLPHGDGDQDEDELVSGSSGHGCI
jgi:hypothetical protein